MTARPAKIEALADVLESMGGSVDAIRQIWDDAELALLQVAIPSMSGAADELEYYGETHWPSVDTPHTPKISERGAETGVMGIAVSAEDDR